MAEKRDYYEVLGIPKDADDAAIKKAYRALAKNTILIRTPATLPQRRSLKKLPRRTACSVIPIRDASTTSLVPLRLTETADRADSAVSIFPAQIWEISLAISSAIFLAADDPEAVPVIMDHRGALMSGPVSGSHLKMRFSDAKRDRA